MKRTLIILAAFAAMSIQANAQIFAGGSISLQNSGGKDKVGKVINDDPTATTFSIAPNIGYILSDDLIVGARISFTNSKENDNLSTPTIDKETEISFAPYARYKFAEFSQFKLWGEAYMGLSRQTGKSSSGGLSVEDDPSTIFSFNILPVVTYDLGEHFILESRLNFARFAYVGTSTKGKVGDDDWKSTSHSFTAGASSSSILTTGNITIGILYKF